LTVPEWSKAQRAGVFALSSSSIFCLLSEFYGLCSMRTFTFWIFIPAMFTLVVWLLWDQRTTGALSRPILIGAAGGLAAAVAYDIFRLPFVFSREWGLGEIVPPLNLFKVFPAFGAMVLATDYPREQYTPAEHLIGWGYHFSNGLTFGLMYVAAVGRATLSNWFWAVVMAVGLEIAMLVTPYAKAFAIPLTGTFIAVTLAAHLIFGAALGLLTGKLSRETSPS
jgi:hypothetical protein